MSADENPDREDVMDATDEARKARREERAEADPIVEAGLAALLPEYADDWMTWGGREELRDLARTVIAAVRPLIEQAQRERCAVELEEMAERAGDEMCQSDALVRFVAAGLREGGRR